MIRIVLTLLALLASAYAERLDAAFLAWEETSTYPPDLEYIPVFYEGRVRPLESCARLWLKDVYKRETLLAEHRQFLHLSSSSPLEFLWRIPYDPSVQNVPLFWIEEDELKTFLGLRRDSHRFCYVELRHAFEDVLAINLKVIEQLILSTFFKTSQGISLAPGQKLILKIINADIECLFLEKKLVVTSAPPIAPWHFLSALCRASPYTIDLQAPQAIAAWEKTLNSLLFHFLLFKDVLLSKTLLNTFFLSPFSAELIALPNPAINEISSLYNSIFSPQRIDSSIFQFFELYQNNSFSLYPSVARLKAENVLSKFPILRSTAVFYGISLLGFLLYSLRGTQQKSYGKIIAFLAWISLGGGFLLHGSSLLFKAIVVAHPPLSTMFDSVLFVAWLAILIGFLFFAIFRNKLPIFASLICCETLFVFLSALNIRDPFAPVDPVLNSSFWLTVHVAMVTSSYGILLLGGVLGHLSLASLFWRGKTESTLLSRCIVQCLYLGSFFLVIGTLLGGVWADSSWGRFWDWDTKESWAFISICFYLALLHLNHFKWIDTFKTALGACLGTLLLSFTWYGVNFLLGSGLHSYGKGKGGEYVYLAYIGLELLFLAAVLIRKRSSLLPR